MNYLFNPWAFLVCAAINATAFWLFKNKLNSKIILRSSLFSFFVSFAISAGVLILFLGDLTDLTKFGQGLSFSLSLAMYSGLFAATGIFFSKN